MREVPKFRQWVRGHVCWACGAEGKIEFAHYRGPEVPPDDKGGTGLKPHDRWGAPLCHECHRLQHTIGHAEFDKRAGARMYDTCRALWQHWTHRVPAGIAWRAEHGE